MTVVKRPSPMSKLFTAIIVGMVIITVVATAFVLIRPVWGRFQDGFDSVITDLNSTTLSTDWANTTNTVNGLWWLLPICLAGLVIWWIWMTTQERDYVTVGYR